MKPKLYVFAKAPLMGRAKTRLAAGVGVVHAQRLYRAMTRTVLRRVADPRWDVVVAATPDRRLGLPVWRGHAQQGQGGGTLTPRLLRVLGAGNRGPVCIIGTDSPQVRARDVADAFRLLRRHDLVLGRADDGGFWLIAAHAPVDPALFDGVRWSTATALDDVAANVGRVAFLRTLTDVDDAEALAAVRARPGRRLV